MRDMIEVEDVSLSLQGTPILHGLTFTAEPNRITALLGPNGAGKTTTMRLVAGLLPPDSGSVRVGGFDLGSNGLEARRITGLVTEEPGLYARLTVREQLTYTMHVCSGPDDGRIESLASMLAFTEYLDARAATLSKGTKLKVAIARALVHDPMVLLLDEPFATLDILTTAALEEHLIGRARAGRTILLSTHIMDQAARLAGHVIGIARGRTIFAGAPEELGPDFRAGFIQRLAGANVAEDIA